MKFCAYLLFFISAIGLPQAHAQNMAPGMGMPDPNAKIIETPIPIDISTQDWLDFARESNYSTTINGVTTHHRIKLPSIAPFKPDPLKKSNAYDVIEYCAEKNKRRTNWLRNQMTTVEDIKDDLTKKITSIVKETQSERNSTDPDTQEKISTLLIKKQDLENKKTHIEFLELILIEEEESADHTRLVYLKVTNRMADHKKNKPETQEETKKPYNWPLVQVKKIL